MPSALDRRREALPETFRPREREEDAALERRLERRLAQSFFENRDGKVVVLELGEQEKRLGALRPCARVRDQVASDRPGPRPLAGRELSARGRERSAIVAVAVARRGQPERLLGKLGRGCGRPAIECEASCLVERLRNRFIGRLGREREVPCSQERIVDDLGDLCVYSRALLAEPLVDNRGQQWVGEADRSAVALDEVVSEGGLERLGGDARPLELRPRGRAERRHETERVACGRGELVDASTQ